jgi:hypothetical protein
MLHFTKQGERLATCYRPAEPAPGDTAIQNWNVF